MNNIQIALLLASGFFVMVGFKLWQSATQMLAIGKRARATVIKNIFVSTSHDDKVYYPVVEFITDAGKSITQKLNTGYLPAKKVGSNLEVIYDPDKPATVEVYSIFRLVILPRLLVVVGVGGCILSVLSIWITFE